MDPDLDPGGPKHTDSDLDRNTGFRVTQTLSLSMFCHSISAQKIIGITMQEAGTDIT